jgi:hypothetical protein
LNTPLPSVFIFPMHPSTPRSHYFRWSRVPQSRHQKPAPPLGTTGSRPPFTLGSGYICHNIQLLAEILIDTRSWGRKPCHAAPPAWPFSMAGIGYGRENSHVCSTRPEANARGGLVIIHGIWGERGPERSSWGFLENVTFFELKFSLKTIRASSTLGLQPPPWHGWCLYRASFMEMTMHQIKGARCAQDSRPSHFETYCAGLPGYIP